MISEFLQQRIAAGDFPSAVYLIAEHGVIVLHEALGDAVLVPERIKAERDTIYDLASVTKVLVTGLLLAMLIEEQHIGLETKVSDVLQSTDLGEIGGATVLDVATHFTGLPGWIPFYLLVGERKEILDEIARTPLSGKTVVYGDPNFWLLTFIVETLYGEPITESARRLIFEPLGLKHTSYRPDPSMLRRVAAQETGNAFERQLCRDLGYDLVTNRVTGDSGFRDDLIWGEVHDQNAWFFGNVCGHAGLFSTAEETLKIALQFLPSSTAILRPDTCSLFSTNFTAGLDQHRSLAFELGSTPNSTAGARMSAEGFGHLGFTGTSLWIDPVKERIFILFTNRTHQHELPLANINPIRRRFNELAADHLDGNR